MAPYEYRVTCEADDKPTNTYTISVYLREVRPDGSRSGWGAAQVVHWTAKGNDRLAPFKLYQTLLRATLV